jgi:hypothetical protein
MIGKRKNSRRTADGFLNFSVLSLFVNNMDMSMVLLGKMNRKCPFLQRLNGKCSHRLLETFWPAHKI